MKLLRPLTGEVTVWMDASPSTVWDLLSDVTRIGDFSPETFEARWTRGATGPAAGATFAGHVRRNGVGPVYWTHCTVTACEPESLFEFSVGTDSVALNNWGYRLRPERGGTSVTEYFRLEANPLNRLYWLLLGRLRGRTNERGMRTTLERMRQVVEK